MSLNKAKQYAVMWASSDNIGDDIQTKAAINFLSKKGISEYSFINREELCNYQGPPVNLIMNGWFMTDPSKFLPPKNIYPIFISFHSDPRPQYSVINKKNISFFKKFEPIGCRDEHTAMTLSSFGVESYFTGCLTTLFDEYKGERKGKFLVDINGNCPYIPRVEFDKSKFKEWQEVYHLLDNKYKFNLEYRLNLADKLLEKYRTAEEVITSRLHCMLPCRAMGTKSSFLNPNLKTDSRFGGMEKILSSDFKDSLVKIKSNLINLNI